MQYIYAVLCLLAVAAVPAGIFALRGSARRRLLPQAIEYASANFDQLVHQDGDFKGYLTQMSLLAALRDKKFAANHRFIDVLSRYITEIGHEVGIGGSPVPNFKPTPAAIAARVPTLPGLPQTAGVAGGGSRLWMITAEDLENTAVA